MTSVIYFKVLNELSVRKIYFDDIHMRIGKLKQAIIADLKISDDIQLRDDYTKKVFDKDDFLVRKSSTVVVSRIPGRRNKRTRTKRKNSYTKPKLVNPPTTTANVNNNPGSEIFCDLTQMDIPEQEKIEIMLQQAGELYHPKHWVEIPNPTLENKSSLDLMICFNCDEHGHYMKDCPILPDNYVCYRCHEPGHYMKDCPILPDNYVCYRCHEPGHFMKDCPLGKDAKVRRIMKPSGIPKSFLIQVEDSSSYKDNAIRTSDGSWVKTRWQQEFDDQKTMDKNHDEAGPRQPRASSSTRDGHRNIPVLGSSGQINNPKSVHSTSNDTRRHARWYRKVTKKFENKLAPIMDEPTRFRTPSTTNNFRNPQPQDFSGSSNNSFKLDGGYNQKYKHNKINRYHPFRRNYLKSVPTK